MRILRQLIREMTDTESRDLEDKYFGISQASLDALSKILLEMFGRQGGWEFSSSDPELVALRKRFHVPVDYIGGGAFRIVFSVGNDLVLKISTDSLGEQAFDPPADQMNADDFALGTDADIRGIVPRAYKHADDWSWVLLERVEPLNSDEEFFRFFRSDLLPDPLDLSELGRENYDTLIRVLLDMQNYALYRPLEMSDTVLSYFRGSELARMTPDPSVPLLEVRKDLLRKSPFFRGLVIARKRYNIRTSEIRTDNLGIGSDGRLVLLDSSIFPDV